MKIIEAMKRIKQIDEKIADLHKKISSTSAHLSFETPEYDNPTKKVKEWVQSCTDLTQEATKLLLAIQRTNLSTEVTIELGGKSVTKTIAEWVWRRRKYATLDRHTWSYLTNRGLKDGTGQSSTGVPVEIKVVRNYDPEQRDKMVAMFQEEPGVIDATLEVVNATTDLME